MASESIRRVSAPLPRSSCYCHAALGQGHSLAAVLHRRIIFRVSADSTGPGWSRASRLRAQSDTTVVSRGSCPEASRSLLDVRFEPPHLFLRAPGALRLPFVHRFTCPIKFKGDFSAGRIRLIPCNKHQEPKLQGLSKA